MLVEQQPLLPDDILEFLDEDLVADDERHVAREQYQQKKQRQWRRPVRSSTPAWNETSPAALVPSADPPSTSGVPRRSTPTSSITNDINQHSTPTTNLTTPIANPDFTVYMVDPGDEDYGKLSAARAQATGRFDEDFRRETSVPQNTLAAAALHAATAAVRTVVSFASGNAGPDTSYHTTGSDESDSTSALEETAGYHGARCDSWDEYATDLQSLREGRVSYNSEDRENEKVSAVRSGSGKGHSNPGNAFRRAPNTELRFLPDSARRSVREPQGRDTDGKEFESCVSEIIHHRYHHDHHDREADDIKQGLGFATSSKGGVLSVDEVALITVRTVDDPTNVSVSRGMAFLAVAAFWVSHTCSVYTTKALLSRPGRTIRSVVIITWCQCMVSFLLVLFLGTLGERQNATEGARRSKLLTAMARALPTNALLGGWNSKSLLGGGAGAVGLASVLFCLAVFADNACLGVVNASFFQVARALTLPFVTFMGAVSARNLPPRDLLLPCLLCIVGFALGVHSQTPEAFADGTSMGVMASLLTAAYTTLLARAEPREAWRVTYVTNRNASVLLVPVAVYVGMGDPTYLTGEPFLLQDGPTILLAIMAAVLPAFAGVSTMWQAQAGLGASGQAASFMGRAAFSHILAFHVFGNSPVIVGEAGCCLALTGLALYAACRGGAAVAQAGNVAVPGAARDHFMPSSSAASQPPVAAAPPSGAGGAVGLLMKAASTPMRSSPPTAGLLVPPRWLFPRRLGKRKQSDISQPEDAEVPPHTRDAPLVDTVGNDDADVDDGYEFGYEGEDGFGYDRGSDADGNDSDRFGDFERRAGEEV